MWIMTTLFLVPVCFVCLTAMQHNDAGMENKTSFRFTYCPNTVYAKNYQNRSVSKG